jgi:hypothetical protein
MNYENFKKAVLHLRKTSHIDLYGFHHWDEIRLRWRDSKDGEVFANLNPFCIKLRNGDYGGTVINLRTGNKVFVPCLKNIVEDM